MTGPATPAIATIDDLSGKTVHLREVSSQTLSMKALNERFKQAGKPEAKLVYLPSALEDEDMLEMLNAGLLQAVVVDDWKAKMWAQVLPKVKVREDIVLRPKTKMGWAIRKNSPKLAAELTEFYAYYAKQTGGVPKLQRQYMARIKALKDATATEDHKRLLALVDILQEVRAAVQLRSAHAGRAGLPGVDAQPGCKESRRRDRRDAGHARDRRGAQGRRHHGRPSRTSMPASSTWTS